MHPLAAASRSRLYKGGQSYCSKLRIYAFCMWTIIYCVFDRSARTVFTERWRHLTYSNEPNFINNMLLVAKEYLQKISNVTKRANFYGIALFPRV